MEAPPISFFARRAAKASVDGNEFYFILGGSRKTGTAIDTMPELVSHAFQNACTKSVH